MSLGRQVNSVLSEETRLEAAAWIARLHDEGFDPDADSELQKWLGASHEHRAAFNRMARAWDQGGKIRMRAGEDVRAREGSSRISRRLQFPLWTAALVAMLVLAVFTAVHWRNDDLITAVGQRQDRVLRDGTRVVLNTDTHIEVDYDEHERRVRLVRGEAQFDVSKNPAWPFLVTVGDREIRALGTSFIVRRENGEDFAVTLVEGRISVAPVSGSGESPSQTPQILAPGQRLVISQHHAPAMDRPELSRIAAWERGRVEFDETPLKAAAAEMNRYTTGRVTVPDAEIAQLRIGGEFRAGDSEEFVKIVTAAFGLRAERNGNDIVLSRGSSQAPAPTAR
jgi:transmembrane sensor